MRYLPTYLEGHLSMARQPVSVRAVVLLSAAFLASACSPSASTAADNEAAPDAAPAARVAQAAPDASPGASGALRAALPDFAGLVDRFGPAVVNVSTVARRDESGPGMSPNDPMFEFFRRFGVPTPRGGFPNMPPARGEGSGFIVTPDGYILTNAHVVDGATEVTVRLTDRREFTAKVVGVDERTDVAVIRIDAKGLPTVKIGDPNRLRPGEWVIAIGSPFGFENSVTAGIVSATSRSLPSDNYVPFIQTDVAVNPGNSGGPLFNLDGEVVGINSQIYSRTGGYMGVSFAIPIDVANNVRDQLVKVGRVSRGRIGVTIQEVNAQLADSFGLDRPRGALVGSVEQGGPGDKAGVKPGDVILAVDGRNVERSAQLPGLIASIKPGVDATLDVWRDRGVKKLRVRIAELDDPVRKVSSRSEGGDSAPSRLGLSVRDVDGAIVVDEVTGPAAVAGVQPGDTILGVNGTPVQSVRQLQDATGKAGKTVALLVQRGDAQIFLPIRGD